MNRESKRCEFRSYQPKNGPRTKDEDERPRLPSQTLLRGAPFRVLTLMGIKRSCARNILVEVSPHEKISCDPGGSMGIVRRTIGSGRDRLWNSVAVPIPCLDPFRSLRPRIPRRLRPKGCRPYDSDPKVGYDAHAPSKCSKGYLDTAALMRGHPGDDAALPERKRD
jgi:hypothetical protein